MKKKEKKPEVYIERVIKTDGIITAVDLHDEQTGQAVYCEVVDRHFHGFDDPKKK